MTDNTKPDSAGAAQDRSAGRALVIERDFKATRNAKWTSVPAATGERRCSCPTVSGRSVSGVYREISLPSRGS